MSALLSDGYVTVQWPSFSEETTTAVHRVQFQISWQLTGKGDSWQHKTTYRPDTHIIRYWLLHYTASIGRVTIQSNRADCPTLNLRRTDQHTPPLSRTVGLLVRQSGSIRQFSNLSYLTQAGFVMQIKRTELSNQSIFICDKKRMQGQNRFHPCTCCVFRHFSCACVAYDCHKWGGSNLPRPHLVIFYFFPSA